MAKEGREPIYVVGGGAAGILAAYRAASLGSRVVLLEKKDRLGMKILISGGGKCNITHAGSVEEVLRPFRPNEARFLKPSLYRFTNQEIVRMLERKGIGLYTRPDGRVFPTEGSARNVVEALRSYMDAAGVEIRLNNPVGGLSFEDVRDTEWLRKATKKVTGVIVGGRTAPAERVILCVGGMSYPGTGTTGDGFPWAAEAGHTVLKIRAALAPLFLEEPRVDWAGVAIRNCSLRARQADKVFVSWRGDLLFTHRGLSGPCALGISREIAERRPNGPVAVELDLLPDRTSEQVAEEFKTWLHKNTRRSVMAYIEPLLPNRLRDAFLEHAGDDAEVSAAHLSRATRNRIVQQLKGWPVGSVQHVPLEKGEVVAGGVALDEVEPATMRSRKCAGLYLCGEILDIAGPVGGYNLQAAWSTGWVAGESAAGDSGIA